MMTLLCVDDNRAFLNLLKYFLAVRSDFLVLSEARTGAEAIDCAAKLRPDIVLMDLAMPQVNGFAAIRSIKKLLPQTKVVVLSVHSQAPYEEAAFENGADNFVSKMRLATDLLPTLRSLSETRRRQP